MINKFKAAGTILCGRAMMAQLASEMTHLDIKKPAIVAQMGYRGKAAKAARLFSPGHYQFLPIYEGSVPDDCDFLILAGGRVLTDYYAADKRYKAFVPLHHSHLSEIKEPVSDFIIIDSAFVNKQSVIKKFMLDYANAVTDSATTYPIDFSMPKSFTYSCRTTVFSGHTTLSELPVLLKFQSIKKPLLLTDKGIVSIGLLSFIHDEIGDLDLEIFDDIPADSNVHVVNAISRLYSEKKCDAIIAFGGGSVIDTGKGVYLNVSLSQSDLFEMVGSSHIPRLNTPFITIPTTSGTGSEVTKVAVITDVENERKLLFNSSNLQPDYALLDSRLTISMPSHLTAMTAMDALTHAIEAFTCLGKNPLSDYMAWAAIELIRDNLFPSLSDPENLTHRKALAIASNLAGQAFSNSMVGMIHTIGHSIGSVCHVPHGSCMSILLPHGLEYNFYKIEPMLAQLLWALSGKEVYDNTPAENRGKATIAEIRKMNRLLNKKTDGRHGEKFSDLKNREGEFMVTKDRFNQIAHTALGDASIVYNPEELRLDDILDILEKSY